MGTDGQLYPTGGNAVALGGAELRYNFSRSFQVASFLDNGNVFLETRDLTLSDLRWSAGLGLRYRTPIGPVRLDWGYILDPEPGDERALPLPPLDRPCVLARSRSSPPSFRGSPSPRRRRPRPGRRPSSASSRWWTSGRSSSATSAPCRPCAASPRSAAREAAIDERLMHVEAARLPQADVSPEEEDRALELLVEKRPALRGEVPEPDLRRLLRRQIAILKYVEFRFRPQVRVSDDEVRKAWEEEQAGRPAGPAFEDEQEELRARLERRALDERIEAWVRELRQRADVRYVGGSPGRAPGGAVGPAPRAQADANEVREGGGSPAEPDPGGGVVSPGDRHLRDPQAPVTRHVERLDVEGEAVEEDTEKAAWAARAVKSLKPHCVSRRPGSSRAWTSRLNRRPMASR